MELTAIALARLVAFVEVQAFDPYGRTSTPEVLKMFGGRYSFAKIPQGLAEIDFQKGIELAFGKFGDINIDKLTVYTNGVVIDTRSSTDDCEKVLRDLLDVMREAFGATVKPNRKNFVSQVVFRSSLRLALLNPLLQPIADQLSASVTQELGQSVLYESTAFLWGPDLTQIKLDPVAFSIERRAEVPFSQNTYFSNAPLRTAEHLKILERIETVLLPS